MRRVSLSILVLGLVVVGALSPTAGVRAQDASIPERRLGISWRDGGPTVHFSAVDLADESVRRKLASGLPQTLLMRVYAYGADGQAIAVAARSCRVSYDIWEELYRVEVQTARVSRDESLRDLDAVLHRCFVADREPVGRGNDYAARRGERIYFAVLMELNPLSPSTVLRLRRWLARPAGGGRIGGDAFFGSMVSLFVNRQIGDAERSMRFRSQTVRVP